MAGYRRMDVVPEKERAGIRAVGLHYRVHGNTRLLDLRQPEVPGREDDFVEDPEHVQRHDVQTDKFGSLQLHFEPGVELRGEEGGCALSGWGEQMNRGRQSEVRGVRYQEIPRASCVQGEKVGADRVDRR